MKDKVVIITGASSGIGRALAEEYSAAGAKVVLAARSEDKLQTIAGLLPHENLTVPTDVSKEQDCKNLVERAIEKFGGIDILINNAGISMRALFKDVEVNVLHQLMEVNYWGAVYCTKYALPHILDRKGSIIGVSSIAGYRGLPGRVGYSASKFALQGFLEVLRTEHLKDGLHVLIACPGFTGTGIRSKALNAAGRSQGETPLNEDQLMSAAEVAHRILKATAKHRRTLILTSQGKLTVFLNKWFPALMDKVVYKHFKKEPNTPLS